MKDSTTLKYLTASGLLGMASGAASLELLFKPNLSSDNLVNCKYWEQLVTPVAFTSTVVASGLEGKASGNGPVYELKDNLVVYAAGFGVGMLFWILYKVATVKTHL